jgi:MoaA/NifB/PqqE/SkfB family radical SAM enzyme
MTTNPAEEDRLHPAVAALVANRDRPARDLPRGLRFPAAMVNVTNRCNLRCEHCFVFRDGVPNTTENEPGDEALVAQIAELQQKHGIGQMLWMGGEPLLKKRALRQGLPLFQVNTITTNGTVPLVDFSDVTDNLLYVVSLDGPETINDAIRGPGVFARVLRNISRLPQGFPHTVQCQCVVTRKNQHLLDELVAARDHSRFDHLTFSFYVPAADDHSENAWPSLDQRDKAVETVLRLVQSSGGFVRNRRRSLELMLSKNDPQKVTDACLSRRIVLPLYLAGDTLVTPFCCYGSDVSCDGCGAWVVFDLAARAERADWPRDLLHVD